MDKKKLQNFIAQLQAKSQTYNAAADNTEASESTEACKTFTEDYVITDSEKELFKFGIGQWVMKTNISFLFMNAIFLFPLKIEQKCFFSNQSNRKHLKNLIQRLFSME